MELQVHRVKYLGSRTIATASDAWGAIAMALTKPEHKHTVAPEIVEAKKKKPTTHQLIHNVIDFAQDVQ